jgi:hypothetical protein
MLCKEHGSFDPEYDDPFGAGWIISDDYWGRSEECPVCCSNT